jgi:hypothetical protein
VKTTDVQCTSIVSACSQNYQNHKRFCNFSEGSGAQQVMPELKLRRR